MQSQDRSLSGIPDSEWKALSEKIRDANGRVLLLVHPFYDYVHDKQYVETIHNLLRKSKIPVIILEPHNKIRETEDGLWAIGAKSAFIISTISSGPAVLKSLKPVPKKRLGDADLEMTRFFKKLKSVGVKALFIGGMYAWAQNHGSVSKAEGRMFPNWESKNDFTVSAGCAGYTYRRAIELGIGMVRLIPNALYPSKPQRTFRETAKKMPLRSRLIQNDVKPNRLARLLRRKPK